MLGELFEGDNGSDALLQPRRVLNIVFAQNHISLQRTHAAIRVLIKLNITPVL